MALQTQKAGWTSRGWMSYTIPNNAHLLLGGPNATVPTKAKSGGKDETDPTCFLLNGIPQNLTKTDFADLAKVQDANGHNIKHLIVNIISAGAVITPAARTMTDNSAPDATHGQYVTTPDAVMIENGRQEIFKFDLINLSGGNMTIEVLPYS